jgi:hypothetical protein
MGGTISLAVSAVRKNSLGYTVFMTMLAWVPLRAPKHPLVEGKTQMLGYFDFIEILMAGIQRALSGRSS